MKSRKKIIMGIGSVLLLSFVGVFIFTLLGGNLSLMKRSTDDTAEYAPSYPSEAPAEEPSEPDLDFIKGEEDAGGIGDKIIGTYSMNFETLEFTKTVSELEALVAKYKGYVEFSEVYNQSSSEGRIYKFARHTLRIPKDEVMAFNAELKLMTHMVSENANVQNVTKYYRDTETRLDTLEAQRKRLNELYEEAERIEDIINIESKLNDIIYQIESIKGELQYLDESINYSTVSTYIQEVSKLTEGESIQASFGERLSKALSESVYFFQEAVITFFIVLIYLIPFLIVFGALAAAGNKILKRRRRNVNSGPTGKSQTDEHKDI